MERCRPTKAAGKPIRRLFQVHISDREVGGRGNLRGTEIIARRASKPLMGNIWGVEGGGWIDDDEGE